MTDDDKDLTVLIARGFSGIHDQLRERDGKVSNLSEKMVGVELKIDQLNKTLGKVESDVSNVGHDRLLLRVETLEKARERFETRTWAIIGGMILLLVGFILNFIRIGWK